MDMKTDYELVKEKNYYELWVKYEGLMMIFFKKLPENIRDDMFEDFDEFKQSCFPHLVKAVDSIKLERVKDRETWTLYIQYYRYLQNYTSRQIVKKYIGTTLPVHLEDLVVNNDHVKDYDIEYTDYPDHTELYKSLTEDERFIFDSRMDGLDWKEINKRFGSDYICKKVRKSLKEKIHDFYN